ncbi:MAG: hypothetical protein DGJ47_000231 [Rickettsiaceae bacterium]
MKEYIWFNGQMVLWSEANIHVMTHSLHYSGAVFEGMKSYSGKIFKLEEHIQRLLDSAMTMNMSLGFSKDEIIEASQELLLHNNLDNAYLRPLIWSGGQKLGLTAECDSNIMIVAKSSTGKMQNNLNLCVSPWRKAAPEAVPPQCKLSANYAMLKKSQHEAKQKGYDDALMLDYEGCVAECTTTNIFFIKNEELFTPIADRFLNGITRQAVIEMALSRGMKVNECRISLQDIGNYDSCFLTGTAAEIRHVASLSFDDIKINFNKMKLVEMIQKEYAKLVGKNYGI